MRQVIGAGSVVIVGILVTHFSQIEAIGVALTRTSGWFIFVPVIGILLAMRLPHNKN